MLMVWIVSPRNKYSISAVFCFLHFTDYTLLMLMVRIVSPRNKYSIIDYLKYVIILMVWIVSLRNKYSIINTQRILLLC